MPSYNLLSFRKTPQSGISQIILREMQIPIFIYITDNKGGLSPRLSGETDAPRIDQGDPIDAFHRRIMGVPEDSVIALMRRCNNGQILQTPADMLMVAVGHIEPVPAQGQNQIVRQICPKIIIAPDDIQRAVRHGLHLGLAGQNIPAVNQAVRTHSSDDLPQIFMPSMAVTDDEHAHIPPISPA